MNLYTALGDSITAGVGASSPIKAYPYIVAKLLCDRSIPMAVDTLAHSGWTSTDLRLALSDNLLLLKRSAVTSIWIGGDNLVAAGLLTLQGAGLQKVSQLLSQYECDLSAILTLIRQISRSSIVLCTQYNPFPNTPAAVRAIEALNGITHRMSLRYRTRLAPTHQWFEGKQASLIAGYRNGRLEDVTAGTFPVHPNDMGHLTIARGLLTLLTN
jgi:lysophospholipase L1-like esterase